MFELGVKIDFQEVMPEEFMCKINLLKVYGQSPSNVHVFTDSNHFLVPWHVSPGKSGKLCRGTDLNP
jgi:hypothetical protein